MPAGRPRIPTKLKVLSGETRGVNHNEPEPNGKPQPPKALSPSAKAIWRRAVSSMPEGVFTTVDEPLLMAFCEAVHLHRTAATTLLVEPLVVLLPNGKLVQSPWVAILNEQARQISTLGARLGFDPVSRVSLDMPEGDTLGAFEGLIS